MTPHRYIPAARDDLNDLTDWYQGRQAGLGDDLADEVAATIARIEAQPQLYPRVARCPASRDIREAPTGRFPIVLVYEVTGSEVVILSFTHGHSIRAPWRQRKP